MWSWDSLTAGDRQDRFNEGQCGDLQRFFQVDIYRDAIKIPGYSSDFTGDCDNFIEV